MITYSTLGLHLLYPDPDQPRKRGFDDASLATIYASVGQEGLLHPILVGSADPDGRHKIIVGERRYRAALHNALEEVPVGIASETTETTRLLWQLIENSSRAPLDLRDRAEALARLLDQYPDQKSLAAVLGLTNGRLSQILELSKLTPEVEDLAATSIVTDATTMMLTNQLVKRAPEAAAELIASAKENGKLKRADVEAALAPFKRKHQKAMKPNGDQAAAGEGTTAMNSHDNATEKAPPPAVSSDAKDDLPPALPGFGKVAKPKISKIRQLLAPGAAAISSDELISRLVDAYLAVADVACVNSTDNCY